MTKSNRGWFVIGSGGFCFGASATLLAWLALPDEAYMLAHGWASFVEPCSRAAIRSVIDAVQAEREPPEVEIVFRGRTGTLVTMWLRVFAAHGRKDDDDSRRIVMRVERSRSVVSDGRRFGKPKLVGGQRGL